MAKLLHAMIAVADSDKSGAKKWFRQGSDRMVAT